MKSHRVHELGMLVVFARLSLPNGYNKCFMFTHPCLTVTKHMVKSPRRVSNFPLHRAVTSSTPIPCQPTKSLFINCRAKLCQNTYQNKKD